MSKKITAVQWMAKQILNLNKSDATWSEIYDQALYMEKEQIMDAFEYGVSEGFLTDINYLKCKEDAEFYYNDMFKLNNNES